VLALSRISDEVRTEAMATFDALEGAETDDGARVASRVKVGRNEPCPCGSGKKYEKCCGGPEQLH
jgi:uncharacterized protein YecA (UPF0149 family)